jgi:hypothetical protein
MILIVHWSCRGSLSFSNKFTTKFSIVSNKLKSLFYFFFFFVYLIVDKVYIVLYSQVKVFIHSNDYMHSPSARAATFIFLDKNLLYLLM